MPEGAGDRPSYIAEHSQSNDLRAMAQTLNAFDFQSSNPAVEHSPSAPGSEVGVAASAELNPAVESSGVALEPEPGHIPAWSMGPEANLEAATPFS